MRLSLREALECTIERVFWRKPHTVCFIVGTPHETFLGCLKRTPEMQRRIDPGTQARARSRAQRECEGLRRAVKRNLEKQRDVISALGATSNQRPAVKRELLDLLDASKDEQNALLDAEMRRRRAVDGAILRWAFETGGRRVYTGGG